MALCFRLSEASGAVNAVKPSAFGQRGQIAFLKARESCACASSTEGPYRYRFTRWSELEWSLQLRLLNTSVPSSAPILRTYHLTECVLEAQYSDSEESPTFLFVRFTHFILSPYE